MGNKSGKQKDPKKKQKKPKCTLRVLTLGISGSGKSTFAKQMKIITNGGFDEEEIKGHREILLQNILVGMQELVKQAEKLEYIVEGENRKHCRFFTQMTVVEAEWNEKIAEKVRVLWEDPAIQRTWQAAPGFQLQMNHMDYLMANLDRFSRPDYMPTNEDVLRARQRTTGEHTTSFVVDKTGWDLIDVGGQKPERAKWESILTGKETVNAVIYFGALDEFNMLSTEEPGKTKMEISTEVFKDLLTAETVKEKTSLTIILFLNKLDLLTTKLSKEEDKKQFHNLFPAWDGTVENAVTQVQHRFLDGFDTPVKVHPICALNTGLMSTVFKDVRQTIFDSRLLSSGLRI
eukprot:TRINITY_DN884_c0_g1_i1.p1 TRINITY_DN884_c0_g1~~TRINITY_DN884_c0_g1_i1.p1  ORF type:complete len:346 (-),score=56.15 TRINITY_DN884_c0_g1_i1:64-1101(-)